MYRKREKVIKNLLAISNIHGLLDSLYFKKCQQDKNFTNMIYILNLYPNYVNP